MSPRQRRRGRIRQIDISWCIQRLDRRAIDCGTADADDRSTNGRNITMSYDADRRLALKGLGAGLVTAGLVAGGSAQAAGEAALAPPGARTLHDLTERLAVIPRRRDYKTVPMILDSDGMVGRRRAQRGVRVQGRPQAVLGPHRSRRPLAQPDAQFAQYRDLVVPPPRLPVRFRDPRSRPSRALRSGHVGQVPARQDRRRQRRRNTFTAVPPAAAHDAADFQALEGAFSSKNNSITVLQRRGAVFLACHNAIWELSERLSAAGRTPITSASMALRPS